MENSRLRSPALHSNLGWNCGLGAVDAAGRRSLGEGPPEGSCWRKAVQMAAKTPKGICPRLVLFSSQHQVSSANTRGWRPCSLPAASTGWFPAEGGRGMWCPQHWALAQGDSPWSSVGVWKQGEAGDRGRVETAEEAPTSPSPAVMRWPENHAQHRTLVQGCSNNQAKPTRGSLPLVPPAGTPPNHKDCAGVSAALQTHWIHSRTPPDWD